jgi:hypothetical protein
MAHFLNDDHALVTGMFLGMLMKVGIPAYPLMDDEGNYMPTIRMRLDIGHSKPVDVLVEVKGIPRDE